LSKYLKDISEG